MKLTAAIVLAVVLIGPGGATAGGRAGFFARGSFSGTDAAIAGAAYAVTGIGFAAAGSVDPPGWYEDPATLIVDVGPADAIVFLDGKPLGTAGGLVARGLPVTLGAHVVHVQASGFRTRAWPFFADGTFPIRLRGTLTAE